MKLEKALKDIRAAAYRNPNVIRVLIVVPNAQKNAVVWDEAKFLFETSSLGLVEARRLTYTMTLERGVIVRFCTIEDSFDIYKVVNSEWSHVFVFGDVHKYPKGTFERLSTVVRSADPNVVCVLQDELEL